MPMMSNNTSVLNHLITEGIYAVGVDRLNALLRYVYSPLGVYTAHPHQRIASFLLALVEVASEISGVADSGG